MSQKKRHKSDDEVNNRKAKVLRDQGETTATHEKWVIDFYKVHCLLVINKLAEGWNNFYNSTKEHDFWHLSIIQQSTIKPALFLQTPKAFWHLYFYKTVVAVMLYPLLYCNDNYHYNLVYAIQVSSGCLRGDYTMIIIISIY